MVIRSVSVELGGPWLKWEPYGVLAKQHCTARFIQTTQQWNVARTHLIVGVTCIKLGSLLLVQNVLSLLNVLPLVLSVGCRRVDQYLVQYTGMYFVSSFVR